MSIIKNLAWTQRAFTTNAIAQAAYARDKELSYCFRQRMSRCRDRHIENIRACEKEMMQEAWARPEDVEESRNNKLIDRVIVLTDSRINRIAYAGRVLP